MKNRLMVLDSETCNILKLDKVMPGNNLAYDIGYSVIEPATAEVICEKSYIVREIFFGEMERMQSCYYAEKLPRYFKDIAEGKREIKAFCDVLMDIITTARKENCVAIVAHNARFDIDALNTTFEWLYGHKCKVLDSFEIWDSMKMAKTFADRPAYRKFCEENGYMTKHATPRPRMTAEILYRFITGDNDFIESHTAFEDTTIEREIVLKAYRTHYKMERILYTKQERS